MAGADSRPRAWGICVFGVMALAWLVLLGATALAQSNPPVTVIHLDGYDLNAETHRIDGLCIGGPGWPEVIAENPEVFETGPIVAPNGISRRIRRNDAQVLYAVSPGCLSVLRRDLGEDAITAIDPATLLPE